jgi:hypothetical protein
MIIYLSLRRNILLFQAVTQKGAEEGEGTLGLLCSISAKYSPFLSFPRG